MTAGLSPIFRLIDGATCPSDDVSSLEARREAFKLLTQKGLIRIGLALSLPAPAVTEFTLDKDPLTCTQTGQTVTVTDPGRALITGKRADIGKFKVPALWGLAARAPYFHNGSAATLRNVVEFYNARFNLNFTDQQMEDLVNFLKAL